MNSRDNHLKEVANDVSATLSAIIKQAMPKTDLETAFFKSNSEILNPH